jgi:hypothetical protein
MNVHLYLRRAGANAATFGDSNFHRDRVAAHLDDVYAAEVGMSQINDPPVLEGEADGE